MGNKNTLVDILTFHVLSGQVLSTDLVASQEVATVEGKMIKITADASGVKVGANLEATVVGADNLATNGVAHIIDAVMLPPSALTAAPTLNIVELAQSVDSLSTLVAAVVAGDLVTTLTSAGPFTVFAPTNDAFGALPAGVLDSLLKPENKNTLVDILTFHVLSGQVLSAKSVERTWPERTWNVRMSTRVFLFSGFNKVSRVPAGKAPKASLVGAKTVNGPAEVSVVTRSPATTAATGVLKESTDWASSTMLRVGAAVSALRGSITASMMWATPFVARLSAATTVASRLAPTLTPLASAVILIILPSTVATS